MPIEMVNYNLITKKLHILKYLNTLKETKGISAKEVPFFTEVLESDNEEAIDLALQQLVSLISEEE